MAKKETFYFDSFVEGASIACEAAERMRYTIEHFGDAPLENQLQAMHEIENRGDRKRHEVMAALVRSFITPIEREDIIHLCENIDNVIDSVEDVLLQIHMSGVKQLRSDCLEFAEIVCHCCDVMKTLLLEFPDFRKSKSLSGLIIESNRLEEDGDRLYRKAMHTLMTGEKDPLNVIAWREIYNCLEQCCDACEDVADVVESIAIGNI